MIFHESRTMPIRALPHLGVIVHIAGLDLPDGTHRGVGRVIEDPEVAAELCAALTA